jgi:hypothetical protein
VKTDDLAGMPIADKQSIEQIVEYPEVPDDEVCRQECFVRQEIG